MNILKPLVYTPPPLTHSHSTASTLYTTDTKPGPRRIKGKKDFQIKHGIKVHAYDYEKAPYPLSYERNVLELEGLDLKLTQHLALSVSYAPFSTPPKRILDLGCGTGAWVIEAAKQWPDASLVGFDLVDIQIPPKILEPEIGNRIMWRHGNFLTTKLPFDEDEFDFVHIQFISRGVPENKWGYLFEEVSRVLQPGGVVEVLEDDILFPTLPKWFTGALRVRPLREPPLTTHQKSLSNYVGQTSESSSNSSQSQKEPPKHDHALLEALHAAVYETRFINMRPLAILPSYMTTYFRSVHVGRVVNFPMPPLAPIRPLPPPIGQSYGAEATLDVLERRTSTTSPPTTSTHTTRPASLSFSSFSAFSAATTMVDHRQTQPGRPRTSSEPFAPTPSIAETDMETLEDVPPDITSQPLPHTYILGDDPMSFQGANNLPAYLFLRKQIETLSQRSLAMQLYRGYSSVLAAEEAMWEVLKDMLRNRRNELTPYGWDDDEEWEEQHSRKKFEKLIERYRADMQSRISFWCSLEGIGWESPPREPLSKAELVEEERLRNSMIEARKQATMDELLSISRSVRVATGRK